jgi:hypothetical protein
MCPKSERSSAECIHHTEIVAEIKTSAQQQVLSSENCFCVVRYGNWDSSGYCFDKSKELKLQCAAGSEAFFLILLSSSQGERKLMKECRNSVHKHLFIEKNKQLYL